MTGEERPHGGEKARWIVAHHRVTGGRDHGRLAAGELVEETADGLLGEHVALGAAHQQGRAADDPYPFPEPLEIGLESGAADRRIVLVGPASLRRLAQCVAQPLLDVRPCAARIEREGSLDGFLEAQEIALCDMRADLLAAGAGHGRGDVDDHQTADALGMSAGEGERIEAAEAERRERGGAPTAIIEKRADVGDEVVTEVASPRRPVGVAVAALVDGENVMVAREIGSNLVPAMRGLRASVDQQQGRVQRRSPVEVVESKVAEGRGLVARAQNGASSEAASGSSRMTRIAVPARRLFSSAGAMMSA